jgi:hypothetical protein
MTCKSNAYYTHCFRPLWYNSDRRVVVAIANKLAFIAKNNLLREVYISDRSIGPKPINFAIGINNKWAIWTGSNLADQYSSF